MITFHEYDFSSLDMEDLEIKSCSFAEYDLKIQELMKILNSLTEEQKQAVQLYGRSEFSRGYDSNSTGGED